jgi:YD repeat-containing protein
MPIAIRRNDVNHHNITYPQRYNDKPPGCLITGTGLITIVETEEATCGPGHEEHGYLSVGDGFDYMSPICGDPLPAKECKQGNPVDIFTGNKLQHERHIEGYGSDGLSLSWYYNAQRKHITPYMGTGNQDMEQVTNLPLLSSRPAWMHEYDKRLYFSYSGFRPVIERVHPANANSLYLVMMGENNWVDAIGVVFPTMEEITDESVERWRYTSSDGSSEFYDSQGRLVKETDAQGRATILRYVNNKLAQVRNWKGHTLDFTYGSNGELESVTDSLGHTYGYQFNDDSLLTRITFPDETPDNDTDNPTRSYRYEYEPIPHALTSIIDENDQVAASWSYDVNGRAISSRHAAGVDTTTFNYGGGSTTVTNALGKETTYHYSTVQNIHGVVFKNVYKIDRVEGHPSTHCTGANTDYEYNFDGHVIKTTDWNGNVTTYTRDSEGRELSRTDAPYTSDSRTITTDWDNVLNKPLVVTEPGRITEYTYDDEGRVLSKTQRDVAN